MSKAYKVIPRKITLGPNKGKVMYNVRPVSYGTLTAEDAARQISAESTATPGDVKAVLDRYAHFVVDNLRKGYDIELLGFGTITLRFLTKPCVSDSASADASLVKSINPAFRAKYTMVNGRRSYALTPSRIDLVNYDRDAKE